MQLKITLLAALFLLTINALKAQVPKDATVPMTATLNNNPVSITLNWANPAASNLLILRRTKGQAGNQWILLLSVSNSTQTSLIDNNVTLGQTYEYVIQRVTTINAFGYAHVAIQAPLTDSRGKIILFIDEDILTPLSAELERLRDDLIGDGWQIIEHVSTASSTVQTIKNQIVVDYNVDPSNIKSVFLLGKIPVPYSGNTAWDGHGDHQGAWPSDAYYSDVNGAWTDASINNVTPARAANDNVPGDGKFDQSIIPSPVELQVGRVDFRRLTQGTFGATTTELLKRYLDKNHNWRTGAYIVENKALVDDNFGYFGGEAFAANGFRNAYPLVGESNVIQADFFNNTNPQTYLLGYGTGGGTYQSAGGVGNSTNFANDTVNIVFSNLFGSYHGDWDFETNPFMPASLASRGGILTCAWAGRPHHFYQALASGETIGYCIAETQNAQYNESFFPSFGESGAQVALLGDPTLRAHVVAPAGNVSAVGDCGMVALGWVASSDNAVSGYHVYRASSKIGAYTRLTTNAISGTTFTDNNPVAGTLYYQIRAIKEQSSPGGGTYTNSSTGAITSIVYSPASPPTLSINNGGGILTCAITSLTLSPVSNPSGISFKWEGPNGFSSVNQNVTINIPGNYNLTVTFANGCTNTASTMVFANLTPPTVAATGGLITCNNPNVTLQVSANDSGTFQWSGPCLLPIGSGNIACAPGTYTVTVTGSSNGCTGTATAVVTQDTNLPAISVPNKLTYDCSMPCVSLNLPSIPNIEYYLNGELLPPNEPLILCNTGIYTLTVKSTLNGCTQDYPIEVAADVAEPGASAGVSGPIQITCNGVIPAQLMGNSPTQGVVFEWLGPDGGFSTLQNPTTMVPGTYSLTVTAPNGCTSTDEVVVEIAVDATVPEADAEGGTLNCTNPNIQLNGTSGTPGVTFLWAGPNGFTSTLEDPIISVSGIYTLTVTSPNGCTNTATAEVTQTPNLEAGIGSTKIDCDGSITIEVAIISGTAPFGYLWSNGDTLPITTFPPNSGPIAVTITDANGCVFESSEITVPVPLPFQFNGIIVDVSSLGASDGSITLTVAGGIPPYNYLWSNGADTKNLVNIPAGNYTVTVTDAAGCTAVATFEVKTISAADEATVFQQLTLSPNPTDGLALLSVKLHKSGALTMKILDATGRLVLEKPEVISSEMQIPLDLKDAPVGIYSVFIFVENQSFVRKLVVVR